jgi:hypothetical protein
MATSRSPIRLKSRVAFALVLTHTWACLLKGGENVRHPHTVGVQNCCSASLLQDAPVDLSFFEVTQ